MAVILCERSLGVKGMGQGNPRSHHGIWLWPWLRGPKLLDSRTSWSPSMPPASVCHSLKVSSLPLEKSLAPSFLQRCSKQQRCSNPTKVDRRLREVYTERRS